MAQMDQARARYLLVLGMTACFVFGLAMHTLGFQREKLGSGSLMLSAEIPYTSALQCARAPVRVCT